MDLGGRDVVDGSSGEQKDGELMGVAVGVAPSDSNITTSSSNNNPPSKQQQQQHTALLMQRFNSQEVSDLKDRHFGRTALIWSARNGYPEITELLIALVLAVVAPTFSNSASLLASNKS